MRSISGLLKEFSRQLGWQREPEARVIPEDQVEIGSHAVAVHYERNARAKRYLLRIDRRGRVRVTLPRRGSLRQARQFVRRKSGWLQEQLRRFSALPKRDAPWHAGHEIYFRGQLTPLQLQSDRDPPEVLLGENWRMTLPAGFNPTANLRPWVESQLEMVARHELGERTLELAARHGVAIARIQVRSQVSRWGSCSATGTVSLNWRLIQAPIEVRDYVILHELMHRRELNHSARFWNCVAQACPAYEACERWLQEHSLRIL